MGQRDRCRGGRIEQGGWPLLCYTVVARGLDRGEERGKQGGEG